MPPTSVLNSLAFVSTGLFLVWVVNQACFFKHVILPTRCLNPYAITVVITKNPPPGQPALPHRCFTATAKDLRVKAVVGAAHLCKRNRKPFGSGVLFKYQSRNQVKHCIPSPRRQGRLTWVDVGGPRPIMIGKVRGRHVGTFVPTCVDGRSTSGRPRVHQIYVIAPTSRLHSTFSPGVESWTNVGSPHTATPPTLLATSKCSSRVDTITTASLLPGSGKYANMMTITCAGCDGNHHDMMVITGQSGNHTSDEDRQKYELQAIGTRVFATEMYATYSEFRAHPDTADSERRRTAASRRAAHLTFSQSLTMGHGHIPRSTYGGRLGLPPENHVIAITVPYIFLTFSLLHLEAGLVEAWKPRDVHDATKAATLISVPRYADVLEAGCEETEDGKVQQRATLVKSAASWWAELSKLERPKRTQFTEERLYLELLAAEESDEDVDDGALSGSGDEYED
ncbi:hypothetical protein K438DRAFT_2123313 [Mycena galopus ATCC 62051]|nr:hypothetical protein K438DRAFT_2123313 [Mycena galopus ATCC 62051]